jgi:DNA-directed RNA polymerase subunit H
MSSLNTTTYEDKENIYKSRVTLLKILDERGYDVERFKKISPIEILAALQTSNKSDKKDIIKTLDFEASLKSKIALASSVPDSKCIVRYLMKTSAGTLKTYFDTDAFEPYESTEVIIMLMDNITDIHHQIAVEQFKKKKLRVSFFMISHLTFDPRDHYLVPKHTIVNSEEHDQLKKDLNITGFGKLPIIRYHIDPIVRVIGAVPGDVIRIVRASPSAGIYTFYRYVV